MGSISGGWRGPGIVGDGLVLYLDAGSPSSYLTEFGTTWKDMSGNRNNGTLINSPTYSSFGGGSLLFNGSTNYVSGNTTDSSVYTLNVWAYNLNNTNTGGSVISTTTATSPNSFIQIGGTPKPWQFGNSFNSTQASINQWIMLTAVQTDTTEQLYINGVAVINAISNVATSNLGTIYNIGRRSDGVYLNTYVANAQIYNRALSTSEIQQNYNAQKSRFGLS
jgi:hypothetical protein